jgi:hypothetical protein
MCWDYWRAPPWCPDLFLLLTAAGTNRPTSTLVAQPLPGALPHTAVQGPRLPPGQGSSESTPLGWWVETVGDSMAGPGSRAHTTNSTDLPELNRLPHLTTLKPGPARALEEEAEDNLQTVLLKQQVSRVLSLSLSLFLSLSLSCSSSTSLSVQQRATSWFMDSPLCLHPYCHSTEDRCSLHTTLISTYPPEAPSKCPHLEGQDFSLGVAGGTQMSNSLQDCFSLRGRRSLPLSLLDSVYQLATPGHRPCCLGSLWRAPQGSV